MCAHSRVWWRWGGVLEAKREGWVTVARLLGIGRVRMAGELNRTGLRACGWRRAAGMPERLFFRRESLRGMWVCTSLGVVWNPM